MSRLLFVGPNWKGSSARSLREGLGTIPGVLIDEIAEDQYAPIYKSVPLRVANRLLNRLQILELERDTLAKVKSFKPDVMVVYKGNLVTTNLLRKLKALGLPLINVFPDFSPHSHGHRLSDALHQYDLVISTKPFHPSHWAPTYGYANRCVFVPHGYDPEVHYWPIAAEEQTIDVALAATWRPEYHKLLIALGQQAALSSVRFALSGPGWEPHRRDFPSAWQFPGSLYGRAYGTWLRNSKIVIAPVHSINVVKGKRQPGDQDTTRSYELAASGCFFLHRRTPYIKTMYDEQTEVPMWDDAAELGRLIAKYLPLVEERRAMARRAHLRAVPDYSIPERAKAVHQWIEELIAIKLESQRP